MNKTHDFSPLFEKFIKESNSGKRLKKNGTAIKKQTVANYVFTLRLLQKFSTEKTFELVVPELKKNNKREFLRVKNYWKKFYMRFTEYLYKDLHHYDNYVGLTIKNLRVFFTWLNNEKGIPTGDFHKNFYVRKEQIPILTFTKEQFVFLISNTEFESKLSKPLRQSKDILVFGCTVGLRISDLIKLNRNNIEHRDGNSYLRVRSQKTGVDTCITLPAYSLDILEKYKRRKISLLPPISKFRFNKNIKKISELAGWTYPVIKNRSRNGKTPAGIPIQTHRFCDLVSSHIMRRTAITTMLSLGVPELVVRKISGHSDNSSSFYRYVDFAQQFMDGEITKAYQKLTG